MQERLRVWLAVLPACVLLASPAFADTNRAGKVDLLFGFGSLASDEASIDSFSTLEAGDGTTFEGRMRIHFNRNIGLETGYMWENENTELKVGGVTTDRTDSDTGFFFINALFDLTDGPISPYFAVGFGGYHHHADFVDQFGFIVDIHEDGPLFNAAAGIDGRTEGHLVWAFEVKYLQYEFDGFNDEWSRIQFSGHLGLHF